MHTSIVLLLASLAWIVILASISTMHSPEGSFKGPSRTPTDLVWRFRKGIMYHLLLVPKPYQAGRTSNRDFSASLGMHARAWFHDLHTSYSTILVLRVVPQHTGLFLIQRMVRNRKIVKEVKSSREKIQAPNFEVLSRTKYTSSEAEKTRKRKPWMWKCALRGWK